jgi:phosphoglycolate phosphatase
LKHITTISGNEESGNAKAGQQRHDTEQETSEMSLKGIIFDLDGTLLYTLEDIADAENAALDDLGLPSLPLDKFRWIVGGGADDIAKRLLPAELQSEDGIRDFVISFRNHYRQCWHNKTCLYPGMADLLTILQHMNIRLAVLSNKPEEFARHIVDHYFPDWQGREKPLLFTHVIGQRQGFAVKPDPVSALEIAKAWNIAPADIGFMGDSDIDIFTAQNAGMVSLGAEWGFRGRDELVSSGAQILLRHPLELVQHLS